MARKRVWMLICDGCGAGYTSTVATSKPISEARIEATNLEGWHFTTMASTRKQRDWCGECKASGRAIGTKSQ